ncbi:hypothetical protein ABL78_2284 [Leptomonas seymouri]|uniref:C2H2-type domain-containing protein n=1 Tax=Leptomonas seymouri TaxID=5684 RepID=A0A0N0P7B6_LEPSE|nr:hypothetical protein ABL78_2284 [Leptomonas seymouri]|eukprot:KPI88616.1 hypothetical protein ABL78_2284 [Leptomonas seymouri]
MIHLVCPHCSKEFNGNSSTSGVRSNYRRHLLVHTGERPFPCPYCRDGFTTKPNLRRHIAAIHATHLTPPESAHPRRSNAELVAPMPPLELPTTTLPSSLAASSAPTRQGKPDSEECAIETSGCTPSAGSQTVSLAASEDTCQLQRLNETVQQHPSAPFICEDCELEVSSPAKLRRHQRYYCPFRDNIFADPVQDALNRYRAAQELQQENQEDEGSSCDSSSVGSDAVFMGSSEGSCSGSVRRHRRRSKASASALALTKAEKEYLTRIAAQSGLKFVADAYASESGSDDSEGASGSRSSRSKSSENDDDFDGMPPLCSRGHAGRDGSAVNTPNSKGRRSPLVDRRSPKRTPLHGSFPLDTRASSSLPSPSARVREEEAPSGALGSGDDRSADEDGAISLEDDLLYLHFHRRGSGHRRERHILQKRLRAQEGVLLGLTNSPLRRPQNRPRTDLAQDVTEEVRADGGARASTTSTAIAKSRPDQHRDQQQHQHQSNPSSIVVSEHLLSRADGLLELNLRQTRKNKTSGSSECICPHCNDFNVFSNRRQLTQHMRRIHPVEAARNAARAAAQGPAELNVSQLPPSE